MNPENTAKVGNLGFFTLFFNMLALKKQIATEEDQSRMPMLEMTPTKGDMPIVEAGSRVSFAVGTWNCMRKKTTPKSAITTGVYHQIKVGTSALN